ncbi:MAG: hypothetical protein GOU99_01155 [Candidatus Altiarchaeota archaeon]|nr:hypothetical protein [Candidatus Altiarchaeota archaeon]
MLGILKIRSAIGALPGIRKTIELLKLNKKFTLTVVQDNKNMRGMIQKIKDYVTWGELSKEILETLAANMTPSGEKIKIFHMHPPKGGFKRTIKKHYPRGELGFRKDMNELVIRMLPIQVKKIEKPDSTKYKLQIVKKAKPKKKATKEEKKPETKPKKPAKPSAKSVAKPAKKAVKKSVKPVSKAVTKKAKPAAKKAKPAEKPAAKKPAKKKAEPATKKAKPVKK